MTFSQLLNFEFNSPFSRRILSLYYRPGRFYRIPFGSLRNFELWYDRTIDFHAMLGIWEKNNFSVMERLFAFLRGKNNTIVVYDVGANIGLFTLFFSKFRPKVRMVAFEAVDETVTALKRNLERNSVRDAVIHTCAVSDQDGQVSFFVGHHHKSSLLKDWASDHGGREVQEIHVPSLTLDSYASSNPGLTPDFIKIDVEGGADKVLAGARSTFKTKRPLVMIESHNPKEDKAIIDLLNRFEYDAFRINDRAWVKDKNADYRDRQGVWGTMILVPQERTAEFAMVLK